MKGYLNLIATMLSAIQSFYWSFAWKDITPNISVEMEMLPIIYAHMHWRIMNDGSKRSAIGNSPYWMTENCRIGIRVRFSMSCTLSPTVVRFGWCLSQPMMLITMTPGKCLDAVAEPFDIKSPQNLAPETMIPTLGWCYLKWLRCHKCDRIETILIFTLQIGLWTFCILRRTRIQNVQHIRCALLCVACIGKPLAKSTNQFAVRFSWQYYDGNTRIAKAFVRRQIHE